MGKWPSGLAGVKTLTRNAWLCVIVPLGGSVTLPAFCLLVQLSSVFSFLLYPFLIFLLQLLHITLSLFFVSQFVSHFFPIYVYKCTYVSEHTQREMSETQADAKETALFILWVRCEKLYEYVHDILYVLWPGLPYLYLLNNNTSYFNVVELWRNKFVPVLTYVKHFFLFFSLLNSIRQKTHTHILPC